MRPYRIKHIPTGLYYKPGEVNLTKNGKCSFQSSANRHACCLRIVKPITECFYFTPKKKDNG